MTRETKVGLGVATTFLCLVSLVVASKLRGPETAGAAVPEVLPQQASAGDGKGDGSEQSDAHPDHPAKSALTTVPPSLAIKKNEPLAQPMPQTPAAGTPAAGTPAAGTSFVGIGEPGPVVALSDLNATTPVVQASGWWGRYGQASVATVGTPFSNVAVSPGPAPAMEVAQLQGAAKLPPASPATSLPAVEPMPAAAGGGGKGDLLIPAPAPIDPKGPTTALPTAAAPIPQPEPIKLPPPPGDSTNAKQEPVPLFPSGAPATDVAKEKQPSAVPTPIPVAPAAATPGVEPKQMPLADPLVAPLVKDPAIAPPPNPSRPATGAARKSPSIGTIGITGNAVPVAPLATPSLVAGGAVAAVPAVGRELPKVVGHTDEVHKVDAGQTDFAQLSQRWYGSDKYADALLEYNRRHLLNRSNVNLQHTPPLLSPNQPIYYPPPNVLESDFAAYIKTSPATPKAPTVAGVPSITRPPDVQISPPTPLGGSAAAAAPAPTASAADATITYRVPQADHILRIAQQTLGSMDAWREIVRLNPSLRTDLPIPAGTVLRLPANARVN